MITAILPLPNGERKTYQNSDGNFSAIILEWQLDCMMVRAGCKQ